MDTTIKSLTFLARLLWRALCIVFSVLKWLLGRLMPQRYICSFDPAFAGACRTVSAFSPAKAAIAAACATGVKQGQAIYVRGMRHGGAHAFICHTGLFGYALKSVEKVRFGVGAGAR